MRHRTTLPLQTAIKMPVRDLLRGMSAFAVVTEEALKPAASLLPDGLRSRLRSALSAVEIARSRAAGAKATLADIADASAFLNDPSGGQARLATTVRVVVDAWARLLSAGTSKHLLLSELIVARGLEHCRSATVETPHDRGAAILLELRNMHAAGRLPGTPFLPTAEEQVDIDLSLFATLVWLLADREQTLADEDRLLDLAFALTKALKDEVISSLGERERLAATLRNVAEQL